MLKSVSFDSILKVKPSIDDNNGEKESRKDDFETETAEEINV